MSNKSKEPDEVDSIRLGPGRAMQSWGRGSSGGTKTPAGSFDPEKTALQNRYSALAEQTSNPSFMENRRGSQRSAASSRESSRGRNTQLPPAIRKTPSTSKERDNVIEAVKGLVRGGTSSETKAAEMKKNPKPQLNGKAADSMVLKGPEISINQMDVKARRLVDDFLHYKDIEEAIRCVTELTSPSTIHLFINAAINQVLERSSRARHSLGQLLFTLVKQNIITFDHYKKGFEKVLKNADEFTLAIPLIWEYIGEILEPMLEDYKFSLTFLKHVLKPCIPSQTAGLWVSATLHCAAKRRGTIKLGELWRESKLQWTDFLGDDAKVDEFIVKHKLEFTIYPTKEKPVTPMSIKEIKKNLIDLLEKIEEIEEIFDWIDPDEVDSIRLGPGRAMQSWGRGSSGGTKTPAGSFDPEKTALQNRYSALAEQTSNPSFMENRRGSQRSAASSRESSRGRNTQLPPAIRKTPSTSKERDNVIEAVKGLVRGGTSSETKAAEMKKNPKPQLNGKAADSMVLKGPEISINQMDVKARRLVDDFLHYKDIEEAIRCVTELTSPSTIHLFINAAINQVLERSSRARHSLGQLLFTLVKQNIITFDHYKKGFEYVLKNTDEFALDIPLIWEYIGEILEPMLEDNKFSLTFLKDVLKPCIPSQTAGLLVSATLHCASKRRGTIKLGELWRESKLQWTDFLGDDAKVDEFITKHKLEFTICPSKGKPVTPMSIEEIKKNLIDLLEKTEESEKIFDWINANVSDCTEPKFIRALVSAVHENVIKDTASGCELDVTKLKKRISILTRYIDHNENLELQALYAIQSLMNQLNQPKGILRQIFDILYDDDVITEESFKNWEQSDDINEVEGKGVALHSVKSFFTWLKETDSGDSVTDE